MEEKTGKKEVVRGKGWKGNREIVRENGWIRLMRKRLQERERERE